VILKQIELDAGLSIAEIAKRSRLHAHTVNYSISKMREAGVLGQRRAAVNAYLLGFYDVHLIFSVASGDKARREKFIAVIKDDPNVAWFAEIGGTHQFALSVRVSEIQEIFNFTERLATNFPNLISNQQLSIVNSVVSYGREYLYGKRKNKKKFTNRVEKSLKISVDQIDYQILKGLSGLSYGSERELARLLGLPFSTVRRRITQLESDKVITGYYHHIDPFKLGNQVFKLLVFAQRQDPAFSKKLESFASDHENVVHCIEYLGSCQYELVVEVKEASLASNIAGMLRGIFDTQINDVHVIPIFRHFKANSFPGPQVNIN